MIGMYSTESANDLKLDHPFNGGVETVCHQNTTKPHNEIGGLNLCQAIGVICVYI